MQLNQLKIQKSTERQPEVLKGYILGKTLGEGIQGIVKEAIHEMTGEKVAIKILDKKVIAERR